MSALLIAVLLSIAPVSELRGGIPYAMWVAKSGWPTAFLLCVVANCAIIPLWWLFLDTLNNQLLQIGWYRRFFERYVESARRRARQDIEKYGYMGLAVFVAIPLPATGAYSGVLVGWSLGMDKKKSLVSVALGVVIAGVIVTLVATGALKGFEFFIRKV